MTSLVGRRVRSAYYRAEGVVEAWEPWGPNLCDALVVLDDGRKMWLASHCLEPVDGQGPLPSKAAWCEARRAETKAQLEAIRAKLVAEWHEPWPGQEFGKVILGNAIDRALERL